MNPAARTGRPEGPSASVSTALASHLREAMAAAGGWLSFDRFMDLALYAPGLGYYSAGSAQIGRMPGLDGSDFVTAPALSDGFGWALAAQVAQALAHTGVREVLEFGAGTGQLAAQVLRRLDALGHGDVRYRVVEVSGALRERQAATLAPWADRVQWLQAWPEAIEAVVLGNEVLDAMPVQLLCFDGQRWLERGVTLAPDGAWAWSDRPTGLQLPEDAPLHTHAPAGAVTETHARSVAFIASLAERLRRGAAFFIDYGFPRHEYYHPQRHAGTLMCHRAHRADGDPLADVGLKDITAHVEFTAIALAGQDAGLHVLGYTSQAHFLLNCGLMDWLAQAGAAQRAMAQKLLTEHEMGELFKVIGFAVGQPFPALGFARGDRSHTL